MSAIRAEELLDRKISRFNSVRSKTSSSDYSLREFLGEVRGAQHKVLVQQIREESCEKKQKALKTSLPGVTLSGVGNRKSKDALTEPNFEHSGLLQIDFDNADNPDLDVEAMVQKLKKDTHVLVLFLSPRSGIKVIVPIPQSVDQHKVSFNVASSHFQQTYGLVADEAPKNHRSLCFLSYDPHAFVRDGLVLVFVPDSSLQIQGNTVTQTHSDAVTQIRSNSEEYKQIRGIERLRHDKQIEDKVQKWISDPRTPPELIQLWELVRRRFKPNLGERNKILCEFIPFAHRRMSRKCAMGLARVMREVWDCVCTDPMDQHMREAESLWEGCENTFANELNAEEFEFYNEFSGSMEFLHSPFRICRDLAFYDEGKTETGKFFLGCRELGIRLGVSHKTASEYLNKLEGYEIIEVLSKGRMIGRQATEFKWLLIFSH